MFRNPSPKAPAFPQAPSTEPPASSSDTSSTRPDPLPWQTPNEAQEDAQRRLDAMEREEPKRRLIRDAKALAKLHRITQAQMAEEMGVPYRTVQDWLQFRRAPRTPGTTLLRRWVEAHSRAE